MLLVFFRIGAGHENIINISEDEVKASGDFVYKALESLRGVSEAEGHPNVLKKSERSCDGGFGHIRWLDWNLVVGLNKAYLAVDVGAS